MNGDLYKFRIPSFSAGFFGVNVNEAPAFVGAGTAGKALTDGGANAKSSLEENDDGSNGFALADSPDGVDVGALNANAGFDEGKGLMGSLALKVFRGCAGVAGSSELRSCEDAVGANLNPANAPVGFGAVAPTTPLLDLGVLICLVFSTSAEAIACSP
jgi:hypothetical protein